MTSQFITLLTTGARTATLLIAPDRFLFARDGALDWQLSEGDDLVVATGQVHSVVLNLGNLRTTLPTGNSGWRLYLRHRK